MWPCSKIIGPWAKVWLRHLHYTHNISGEPPPVVVKNKKKVVTIDESQKQ